MNTVILIGRLTKNVELRYTQNETPVATTTLAVNRQKNKNGNQEADFINLVIWNKLAETMDKYCKKGDKIGVLGKIQTRSYEDSNNNKRYVTEVIVESIEFLEPKSKEVQEEKTNSEIIKDVMTDKDPFEEFGQSISVDDEELPF